MADNPKKKSLDGQLVSQQPHEQKYLAKKHGIPLPEAGEATRSAGPSRKKVEAVIAKKPVPSPAKKAVAKKPTRGK